TRLCPAFSRSGTAASRVKGTHAFSPLRPPSPSRRGSRRPHSTFERTLQMNRSYLILAAILASPAVLARPQAAKHVDLGSAAHYAILAQSGISTTGTTSVLGDIGVSP